MGISKLSSQRYRQQQRQQQQPRANQRSHIDNFVALTNF